MTARREVEIEATPRRSGRRWPPRRAVSAGSRTTRTARSTSRSADAPHRLVWWWWEGDEPADPGRVPRRRGARRRARGGHRERAVGPARAAWPRAFAAVVRVSDRIGPVFAALADPTRRHVVETLLREGSTTRARADRALPITPPGRRQAPRDARRRRPGRARPGGARRVRYRLRPGALAPAAVVAGRGRPRRGTRASAGSRARSSGARLSRPEGVVAQRDLGRPPGGDQPLQGGLGRRPVGVVVAAHQQRRDLLGGEAAGVAPQQRLRAVGRRLAAQSRGEVRDQDVVGRSGCQPPATRRRPPRPAPARAP